MTKHDVLIIQFYPSEDSGVMEELCINSSHAYAEPIGASCMWYTTTSTSDFPFGGSCVIELTKRIHH